MDGGASPLLSVIIVAHCDSPNLRMVLEFLRKQTVCQRIELIVVTASVERLNLPKEELEGFWGFRIVEISTKDAGSAKAAGVTAASAPLVAFTEDHSFAAPGCAETFISAHSLGNFAVVGPVMLNANPGASVSWGCFLVFYGPWMAAREGVEHLPANQSCYKRDILLEYGARLPDMLQAESLLHWDLTRRGHRLHHEPAAKIYHLNFSRLTPLLLEHLLASRVFAAGRSQNWGAFKKMFYALGAPLLPLIRFKRILRDAMRVRLETSLLLHAFLPLVLNLCAGSAGEMLGYALGAGTAGERLFAFESERRLHIHEDDLRAISSLGAS